MSDRQVNEKKRVYEPPQLRKVSLAADEVLAVGCKTNQGGFNVNATPCMSNQCVKKGS